MNIKEDECKIKYERDSTYVMQIEKITKLIKPNQ